MNVVIEKQNILWRLFGHCFKWALFSKKFLAKQSKSLMTLTLSLLSDDNKGLQRRWQCSTSSQWSFPFVTLMQIIYWSRRGSFTKWYYIPHRVQGTKHLLKEKKKIISISVTNPIEIVDRNNKQTNNTQLQFC